MTYWTSMGLTDLASLSSGKAIRPGQAGQYPAYGSNGVIGRAPESRHESGIILGRVGAYCGSVAVSRQPFWASDNTIVVEPLHPTDIDFLFYLLTESRLNQHAGGAAQPLITQTTLKRLTFRVPDIACRARVGRVLRLFDELIENNMRRIEILEEMAQSLYREWFVNLRYPGHEDIPLVDSDLGPTPQGWSVEPLAKLTTLISRGVSPKYSDEATSIVINQKCIRDGRMSVVPARRHRTKVPDQKLLRFGDVLINSTGVGTLGRVAQLYRSLEDATVDSHVTIVRPAPGAVDLDYVGIALLCREPEFEAMGVGSTGQTELGRARIAETLVLLPTSPIMAQFGQMVAPMRELAVKLIDQVEVLRSTRDVLLPRLISGEVDVSNLDIDTGELVS